MGIPGRVPVPAQTRPDQSECSRETEHPDTTCTPAACPFSLQLATGRALALNLTVSSVWPSHAPMAARVQFFLATPPSHVTGSRPHPFITLFQLRKLEARKTGFMAYRTVGVSVTALSRLLLRRSSSQLPSLRLPALANGPSAAQKVKASSDNAPMTPLCYC